MKKLNSKMLKIFLSLCLIGALGSTPGLAQNQAGNILNQILTGQEAIQQAYATLQQMINQNVVDSQGQNIGQVENILIGQNGGIDYIIVNPGYSQQGLSGRGGELIPIPWDAANPTYLNGRVQISVSRQQLQNAPVFSANQWPNFASPNVENKVRGYYGSSSQQRNLNQEESQEGYGNPNDLNQGGMR